jgi:hypothetical protein
MLERHKRLAEIWLRDVRTQYVPKMGPVHFDYIENLQMNALAFESNDHDFVGIYIGAIVTTYGFFGSLLSYPRSLMSIGNPLAEGEVDSTNFEPNQPMRVPGDPARRSYAHLLATIAIDFLFAHELGHLMHGHVKLMRKRTGIPFLAEFDLTQKTHEENLMLQTLEMDADSFAVGQGLATAFGRCGDPSKVFPPDWRPWYNAPREALFTWTLAIYAFFRLFYRGTANLDDLESTNHPPPSIRMWMILSTLVEFLKKKGLEGLTPQMESIIGEVMQTVETAHAIITSTPIDLSGVQQTLDPRATKHVGRILDQWKILRPQLVPLNRCGTLAE